MGGNFGEAEVEEMEKSSNVVEASDALGSGTELQRQRFPDERQFHQDWNHFNSTRPSQYATPRDYWDSTIQKSKPQCGLFGSAESFDADKSQQGGFTRQPNARLGRFNAPAQFEKDIKQSEKYERWLKWKTTFDIALSICDGVPSDRQKTGLLHTYVGDEVRDVIAMLQLPPMHVGRVCREGEYAELSRGLNDYFRTLVDESTDFARYNIRKQLSGESVHQFAMKLRDLAIRVNIGHETIGFRHQFLMGLSNRALARKANEEGLSIGEIIQQAGRIEQATEIVEPNSWESAGDGQAAVLALAESKGNKKQYTKPGTKRRVQSRGESPQRKW